MSIDHSLDYQKPGIFNSSKKRLENIMDYLTKEINLENNTFADVGCSTGYITSLITQNFNIKESYGFDTDLENLAVAKERYSTIEFNVLNLNNRYESNGLL
ncbi:MAG: class I SAM-dependent methyltransferase [Xenococcaceae cyanobacterium MO_207.B15]|nr:class I SAM-dependent methyltransferase [Xenococcaceae cyanobacterium MO_207.B15]